MLTINEYTIPDGGVLELNLPPGARAIGVRTEEDTEAVIDILGDFSAPENLWSIRRFEVLGEIPSEERHRYIGSTSVYHYGWSARHIFEVMQPA